MTTEIEVEIGSNQGMGERYLAVVSSLKKLEEERVLVAVGEGFSPHATFGGRVAGVCRLYCRETSRRCV